MSNDPPAQASARELTWSCVEDGFYVASCDGEYLGFIDRIESDSFQVSSAGSQQLGFFSDLDAAMRFLIRLSSVVDGNSTTLDVNEKGVIENDQ